ncbi:hypothetical protein OH76DRAFT_757295 [Lentinus brumalis]|uniref:Uncharacterized protein n=1 Tax=Lentinus brumalis TaxID=2498619 RepID=A0A371DSX3_9APHY|nr:hypothetical protein OH76DRAFT_757295 [Polyporus brumalis]
MVLLLSIKGQTLSAFSRRVASCGLVHVCNVGSCVTRNMPAAVSTTRNAGQLPEDLTTAPGKPTTSDRDTYTSDGRTLLRNPGRTILVFSLVLAPLAILPYVLVRRHVLGLRKEIADLRKVNGVAIKEMKMYAQEVSQQHAAATEKALEMQKKNRTILSGVKSEVEASRKADQESGARLKNIENDLSKGLLFHQPPPSVAFPRGCRAETDSLCGILHDNQSDLSYTNEQRQNGREGDPPEKVPSITRVSEPLHDTRPVSQTCPRARTSPQLAFYAREGGLKPK